VAHARRLRQFADRFQEFEAHPFCRFQAVWGDIRKSQ
jgi:hypothetical protein